MKKKIVTLSVVLPVKAVMKKRDDVKITVDIGVKRSDSDSNIL